MYERTELSVMSNPTYALITQKMVVCFT